MLRAARVRSLRTIRAVSRSPEENCLLYQALDPADYREPFEAFVKAFAMSPFAETTIGIILVESTRHMVVIS